MSIVSCALQAKSFSINRLIKKVNTYIGNVCFENNRFRLLENILDRIIFQKFQIHECSFSR